MKLSLYVDRERKFLGKLGKYQLFVDVCLSEEERLLLERHRIDEEVLIDREVKLASGAKHSLRFTVGGLVAGPSYDCEDTAGVIAHEEAVRAACEEFKKRLAFLRRIGQEADEVEY